MPVTVPGTITARSSAPRTLAGKDEPMTAAWVPVLAEIPLFAGLSRSHLRRVARLGRTKRYAPAEILVRKGDPGDSFFLVLDGRATVQRPSGPGVTLRSGDFFGELALVAAVPRTATVVAETEVLVMRIPRAGFQRLLREEPAISLALLRTLAERFAGVTAGGDDAAGS